MSPYLNAALIDVRQRELLAAADRRRLVADARNRQSDTVRSGRPHVATRGRLAMLAHRLRPAS